MNQISSTNQIELTLTYEWEPVLLDQDKQYTWPNNITKFMRDKYNFSAIYRWVVEKESNIQSIYIGEASLLPRRIYQYLNPGKSQQTNNYINHLFGGFIHEQGYNIKLEKLKIFSCELGDKKITENDLDDKNMRVLVEHLLLVYYENKGFDILNK
jgi:hypothetical protein